jgi:hypothetical protein
VNRALDQRTWLQVTLCCATCSSLSAAISNAMFCYVLGCPVVVLLAERDRLCTCANIVVHCDGSGGVACVCLCVCRYSALIRLSCTSTANVPGIRLLLLLLKPLSSLRQVARYFCCTYISGVGRDKFSRCSNSLRGGQSG